ncbi:phenylalanine--tRNA ligase subunit beta [Williamwhitmania taraxaci]|uniref:Phenylalanine--tRNA ligase beta subunit n=1 Tax=Williamwhitmania taraxaci TaxID=1640674 RepID=A0A1G6LL42_9BACT|nr:phenylalanine--tRNA ligase subunit beta [Williamwhitmania taraxaci]SDC43386.1 phenylalanyl-tRNA synthetase beta subunit [Williamwhitmania taraxaci]
MRISYSWLKDYLKTEQGPEEISRILTDIGLEVESLEKEESVKGGLEGIVIGYIVECEQHPNADKLSVTKVDVGGPELLQIVCGASNVAKGQKVPVATIGTTLYSGDENFKIKKSKLRGVDSEGMICAEDELGLGHSHDGIMVLDPATPVGTPAREYFKIEDDYAFEIGLTPNRIDAASHFGVARDLAAYFFAHGEKATLTLPSVDAFKVDNNSRPIKITVENSEACPRYTGITISGITVAPSPEWLQKKLRAIGLNPINNVVDITNFILQELGQPLHAFDADQIKGNHVRVKTMANGTAFTTLDEQERKLHNDDLMICNETDAMCMAGVFGGIHSGVSIKTTNIFIESAYFNPVWVRKAARRHGLSTDASFRFERGTDPNITIYAIKRAAMLIKEIAGGQISSEIIDVYPTKVENQKVEVNLSRMCRFIGKEIPSAQLKAIFHGLEMEIISEKGDDITLSVPAYRVDVTREADVVEDVLRIYGYNNVEISQTIKSAITIQKKPDKVRITDLASEFLSANGFNEIMSNSLTKTSYYQGIESFKEENTVKILNPLSSDLNGLRQTLLFNGLETAIFNINRRNSDLKFYEFGNCYSHSKRDTNNLLDNFNEDTRLGMLLSGNQAAASWNQKAEPTNFFVLKSYAEKVLHKFGVNIEKVTIKELSDELYSDGLTYFMGEKVLFTVGKVNPKLLKQFDIKQDVYFAEVRWDVAIRFFGRNTVSYSEMPKFPEVKRDLALLINSDITFKMLKDIAHKTEKKLLKTVSLFDVYEGPHLGEGKKSYALSFIIQDETKTLTDVQIDGIMNNLIAAYEKEVGAKLR